MPTHDALAAETGIAAHKLTTQGSRDTLDAVRPLLESGQVKPQVYLLSETAAGWQRQAQPGVRGKIVLIPDGTPA